MPCTRAFFILKKDLIKTMKREGAGRPKKEGELRKMCAMRATREEWDLIQAFARILKYGDKDRAKRFVEETSRADSFPQSPQQPS